MRLKIPIKKEKLEELYIQRGYSPKKIAKVFHCHSVTILNRLKEFKIQIRSNSESRMRYKKYNFSGNLKEKAYILGFRLGDLNVYQTNKDSSLVVVRCHTTKWTQVKLLRGIFSRYGKVTVSVSKYGMNVNCYLNKSFKFLLPKITKIPNWVEENEDIAFSFIAGYTDAEGNFLLNQSKARFKIDSYDTEILSWMVEWLSKKNIRIKFRRIAKKGDRRPNGTSFKSDLLRLNVNEAVSLLNFIRGIKPFSLHKERIDNILICERNILQRIKNGTVKYGFAK